MGDKGTRQKLIDAGHRLLLVTGDFSASGVGICREAGTGSPASMTQHFPVREDLLLAILEKEILIYRAYELRVLADPTTESPLARLKQFISMSTTGAKEQQLRSGYLFSNLAATTGPELKVLRARLAAVLREVESSIAISISAAKLVGEFRGTIEPRAVASLLFSGIQKARLEAKLTGSRDHFDQFKIDCIKLLGQNTW